MRNLTMMNSTFRILQLTDIHLMNESTDEETYVLIRNVINETHPDFIIITGDITMTYDGQRLLENLRDFLDSFHVFWSFVFGNHDHESILSLDKQADILMEGKYCLFEKGNALVKGCGNHYLRIDKNDNLVALLGMLDSHNYRIDKIDGKDVWSYDYLDQSQIDDSIRTIESLKKETESFSSLFFFHIPLVDFKTAIEQKDETIVGSCLEEIFCSKYDSGFFTQVVNTNT
ncbi:MAG: metallophosphoesterase, partial [Candidatus Izemoplasmatales bacterium]|nr:metallophosphoesterase [Candidatus Izemoplasmatales bacterium]